MHEKKGKNLEDVFEMNRSLLIRLMRNMQICSRADLAKASGLQQATITNIINDFISLGIVRETGIISGNKGRRSIGITLNSNLYRVIGVRLSRKYVSLGLFDLSGTAYFVHKENIDMLSDPASALERMKDLIRNVLKETSENYIVGIGVAIPGPFYHNEGKIALMTEFPGWEEISLKEELESAFGIPIYLEHDANAGALAEWWMGSNRLDAGTLVYVAAGQGIGAGIIIDGQVFRGSMGIAGEIGHMTIDYKGPKCQCGNRGCLEYYCSTLSLIREVKKELPNFPASELNKDCSLKAIFDAIRNEDELALHVFKKLAWFIGFGLSSVINVYNPNVVTIGDEWIQAGNELLKLIKETVKEHILPSVYNEVIIELSSFTNDPVLVGASALAIDKALHKPSLLINRIPVHVNTSLENK